MRETDAASPSGAALDAYAAFGVRPLINACGIYTDLGGSTMDAELWAALGGVNGRWASVLDLLDATGADIAARIGTEDARVVPGASAAIALAIATCIVRRAGEPLIETLPAAGDAPREVVQQVAHRYKYTRCALLGGGRIHEIGTASGTTAAELEAALAGGGAVAILHPAHLDGAPGALPLEEVARIARPHDVPVIVDAAYQVYPVELIGSFAARGADLTCISSKYFGGPNAGGFVAGRHDLVRALAKLDFTEFESGPLRNFGRAFKLDRTTIVAVALTLQRWLERDHDVLWADYRQRAERLVAALSAEGIAGARTCCFTLDEDVIDEPVNAVVLPHAAPAEAAAALAAGTPAVRCVPLDDGLLFCVECVRDEEAETLAAALAQAVAVQAGS